MLSGKLHLTSVWQVKNGLVCTSLRTTFSTAISLWFNFPRPAFKDSSAPWSNFSLGWKENGLGLGWKTPLLCRLQRGSFPSSLHSDPSTALLTRQVRDYLPPPNSQTPLHSNNTRDPSSWGLERDLSNWPKLFYLLEKPPNLDCVWGVRR